MVPIASDPGHFLYFTVSHFRFEDRNLALILTFPGQFADILLFYSFNEFYESFCILRVFNGM